MSSSSTRRVHNDIAECESNSDKFVDPNSYYVVKVIFEDSTVNTTDIAKKTVNATEPATLVTYSFGNELYILFSSIECGSHFLNGSHHGLCSHYTSEFVIEKGCKVSCSVVEIESRSKVLVYFQTKVYDAAKKAAFSAGKGKLTKKDISQLSITDISELLKKAGVVWDDLDNKTKYGCFYKKIGSDGKYKLSTLSESISLRDADKYLNYFFG
jgi:hypothetical protein